MSAADEWNACNDPKRLFEIVGEQASLWQARLFAIGLLGYSRSRFSPEDLDRLERMERVALGSPTESWDQIRDDQSWAKAHSSIRRWHYELQSNRQNEHEPTLVQILGRNIFNSRIEWASLIAGNSPADIHPKHRWHRDFQDAFLAALAPIAEIIRCVFPNPHRDGPFDPRWRTETAIGLAGQMFETREFGAMPILADALQDAGCEDAVVLNHCRSDGPHVRGCWVVDAVLSR